MSTADTDPERIAIVIQSLLYGNVELNRLTEGRLAGVVSASSGPQMLLEATAYLRQSTADAAELRRVEESILDAMPAHVALLDPDGRITYVNAAWAEFGVVNEGRSDRLSIGANYLDVCDGAADANAEEAVGVATGIRDVLSGDRDTFSLEYPCHSDATYRWFRVVVSPALAGREQGVIVMHINVTERRIVEESLRESELRYRHLFELHPHPMWVFDLSTLRFLAVNDAAVARYGYSRAEFLEMTISDIRPADDMEPFLQRVQRADTPEDISTRWIHIARDGTRIIAEISAQAIQFAGHRASMVQALDVTSRSASETALQQSEAALRLLSGRLLDERTRLAEAQAVAKIGSWELDSVTNEVRWSAESFRIYDQDPTTSHPNLETLQASIHPRDRAVVDAAFLQSATHEGISTTEYRLLQADGSTKLLELRWRYVFDADGKPARAVGTVQDVTERRDAGIALRLSEERFRVAANASSDALWDWDLLTDAVWWNDGLSITEEPDRSEHQSPIHVWTARIHADDRDRVVAELHAAIASGTRAWRSEYRFHRQDESVAFVLDRGSIVRDATGAAIRLIGGMTDLTNRRADEVRLAQQAALLDAAYEGIIVKDLDDRIVFWNKGAERTFGYDKAHAIGKVACDLLDVDPARYQAARESLMLHGHWEGELVERAFDGNDKSMSASWTLITGDGDNPTFIFSITTDITEKKRLETQYLRAQRLESLGTIAGGIAHDLNNMLTPILISAELMRAAETDPEQLASLATIEASAQRGADMVRQVLTFARGGEGHLQQLDLAVIAQDVVNIARTTFPKNVSIQMNTTPRLRGVFADPTHVHQILMNLCVNARDAMPQGGLLSIDLSNIVLDDTFAGMDDRSVPGEFVLLTVTDTGDGIPAEIQDRLFEPFFTTKEQGKGTGLGLSTVQSIVRSLGGFISLLSVIGKGAEFSVYLPAMPGELVTDETSADAVPIPRGTGQRILVVDDEEAIRTIVHRTLERFGYRAVFASNGAEAVARFVENRGAIDAVVTDMAMPVMDGHALVTALRAIDPAVRIIGSSGLLSTEALTTVRDAGLRYFIRKPYTAEVLLRILHRALTEDDSPD